MKRIGRYQFTKTLHQHDGATIYLAYDPVFECDVVVKVLKLAGLSHETKAFHQDIEAEAKAIISLKHDAILPLYDARIEQNRLYLVMPYLCNGSLAKRMQKKPYSPLESVQLLRKLTPALSLAHAQGITHCNLKPTNVLFDDQEQPYLTDFTFTSLHHTLNLSHTTSLAYNSPEQASHVYQVDRRSDIYALGVIFFELLTGTLPYQASEPRSLAYKHLYNPIPTPSALQTNLPSIYDSVIKKVIAKAPSARFNTIEEFNTALDAIIADEEASKFYTSIPYAPSAKRRSPQTTLEATIGTEPQHNFDKLPKTRTPASYRPKKEIDHHSNRILLTHFLSQILTLLRTWPGIATFSLLLTILVLLFLNIEYILGIIVRSYFP